MSAHVYAVQRCACSCLCPCSSSLVSGWDLSLSLRVYFYECVCVCASVVIISCTGLTDNHMIMKYESSDDAHGISHPHLSHALSQGVCVCIWCGHAFFTCPLSETHTLQACENVQGCESAHVLLNALVNKQLALQMGDLHIKQQRQQLNMIYARICHSNSARTEPFCLCAVSFSFA